MRIRSHLANALLPLALASPSLAAEPPAPAGRAEAELGELIADETPPETPASSLRLRASLGAALTEPAALNAWLTRPAGALAGGAAAFRWSGSISAALAYSFKPWLAVGLKLQYSDVQTARSSPGSQAAAELSALVPFLTAEAKAPPLGRLTLGTEVGAGIPVLYRLSLSQTVGQAGGSAAYTATPPSVFAGLTAAYALTPRAALRLEAGYLWQDAGQLRADGTGSGNLGQITDGAALEDSGRDVPASTSAPFAETALELAL